MIIRFISNLIEIQVIGIKTIYRDLSTLAAPGFEFLTVLLSLSQCIIQPSGVYLYLSRPLETNKLLLLAPK